MKIVLPMAGRGTRLREGGYQRPKPLVEIAGRPMVAWVVERLFALPQPEITFVALAEHSAFGLREILDETVGGPADIVLLDEVTDGQLCTVLAAADRVGGDEEVLIAPCDTLIDMSSLCAAIGRRPPACRGLISVANLPGDRWSFARTSDDGRVVEVAEKLRISEHASTGFYHFSSGAEFVRLATSLVERGERTRGEFFVIPVYQEYIARELDVRVCVAREVQDLGDPAGLQAFVDGRVDPCA